MSHFVRMSPQHRLDILGVAMEAWCLLEFCGVEHGDFAPRNILLMGPNVDTKIPKVKNIQDI
jgi:hypothetical protein